MPSFNPDTDIQGLDSETDFEDDEGISSPPVAESVNTKYPYDPLSWSQSFEEKNP